MENTSTSVWKKKDYLGLCIIPLEFLVGTLLGRLPWGENKLLAITVNLSIFFAGFLIMLFLFKDVLKEQWKLYKKNKLWLKLFLNIISVIGAFGILAVTKSLINKPLSINDPDALSFSMISIMLISSIQPFIAPFAEELTFRYLLFQKIPKGILKIGMLFVSSILFGLIHINNFNGDWMQTIPYMIIGVYFALICYFFKNIWGSIITHWIFNSINSIVPALGLFIAKLFGLL